MSKALAFRRAKVRIARKKADAEARERAVRVAREQAKIQAMINDAEWRRKAYWQAWGELK